jgi:hypothetical protein
MLWYNSTHTDNFLQEDFFMRLLFVIPHFYRPEKDSIFGSLESKPDHRIAAFAQMLHTLYQNFHSPHALMNIADRTMIPANHAEKNQLDVVICTTGEHHVLNELPVPKSRYVQLLFK